MDVLFLLYLCALTGSVSLPASAHAPEACPERILGNERRRTCLKPCTQDRECGNKRQCLCDGQCGLSCVAPGRTCPWPLEASEHSVARLLSPAPSFSALLEVRCEPGYTLPSELDAAIRRCQGDRRWSGDDPVCSAAATIASAAPTSTLARSSLSCPLSKELVDTFILEGSATLGSSIHYSCKPGYELIGSAENVCQDNQTWQNPHPICLRFCPPPEEVEQGYLVAVQRKVYEVGEAIYYLCKKSFLLDGSHRVICQSNGTWSAVPFCRAQCPLPVLRSRVVIAGVKVWPSNLPDRLVQHGERVTFFCKHPEKQCSYTADQSCFDGRLKPPSCYLEPTWLQYKLFPHRLVSEISACDPSDLQ